MVRGSYDVGFLRHKSLPLILVLISLKGIAEHLIVNRIILRQELLVLLYLLIYGWLNRGARTLNWQWIIISIEITRLLLIDLIKKIRSSCCVYHPTRPRLAKSLLLIDLLIKFLIAVFIRPQLLNEVAISFIRIKARIDISI